LVEAEELTDVVRVGHSFAGTVISGIDFSGEYLSKALTRIAKVRAWNSFDCLLRIANNIAALGEGS
jgi:hypothetical protein